MVEVHFSVDDAAGASFEGTPAIRLSIVVETLPAGVRLLGLDVLVEARIEPARREHSAEEAAALADLFGPRERWRETLRPFAWTQAPLAPLDPHAPRVAWVLLPCALSASHAAGRYLLALRDGEVPLRLLFRGITLHEGPDGALRVAPVPWTREAAYRLPLRVVREAFGRAAA